MNLRILGLLLTIVVAGLAACTVWIVRFSWGAPLIVLFARVTAFDTVLLGILWLAYTIYAMFGLVPKTDAIVNPELRERLQLHGDFTFFRMHRLIFYGTSSACRWCNGRLHPEFNFRRLPKELRIPLAVHFHATWIGVLLAALGAAAFKVAELWGIMNV